MERSTVGQQGDQEDRFNRRGMRPGAGEDVPRMGSRDKVTGSRDASIVRRCAPHHSEMLAAPITLPPDRNAKTPTPHSSLSPVRQ